jgi:hypothetical protein
VLQLDELDRLGLAFRMEQVWGRAAAL